MNRKALQLAISTLVLIVLGIAVLIGLIFFVTDGFENLKSTSQPFLDTTKLTSIKQACEIACQTEDRFTFCCNENEIDDTIIECTDSRIGISCDLSCYDFACSNKNQITPTECENKGGREVHDIGDGSAIREMCGDEEFLGYVVPGGIEGTLCCK